MVILIDTLRKKFHISINEAGYCNLPLKEVEALTDKLIDMMNFEAMTTLIGKPFVKDTAQNGAIIFIKIDEWVIMADGLYYGKVSEYIPEELYYDLIHIQLLKTYLFDEYEKIIIDSSKTIDDLNNSFLVSKQEIETNNIDVKYEYMATYYSEPVNLRIELKPSISEDYPNILRKAKKQYINLVFCDHFTTSTTSYAKVQQMFKDEGILLLKSGDMILPEIDNTLSNYLQHIDSMASDGKIDTENVKIIFKKFYQEIIHNA